MKIEKLLLDQANLDK